MVPQPAESELTAMKKSKEVRAATAPALPTLAELERDVVREYRELGRQELARRLQQLADQTGELFPPAPTQAPPADPAH
jgi:hypothetical protein